MRQSIRFFFKLLGLGLGLFLLSFIWNLPNMALLIYQNPTQTPFMDLHKEKLLRMNRDPSILQVWAGLPAISNHLKKAVLAAEDDTFFEHKGFNWKEIEKAYLKNKKAKRIRRGASTITQQLVKNLYLGPQKSFYRKLKEALLTVQMERTLSKDRILELYLNVIEWGPGIFGAQAAAQHYFHKDAKNLTASEAAKLAALIPNPLRYSQPKYASYIARRAALIQKRAYAQALAPKAAKVASVAGKEEPSKPSQEIADMIEGKYEDMKRELEELPEPEVTEAEIPEF